MTYTGSRLAEILYTTKIDSIRNGDVKARSAWKELTSVKVTYAAAQTTITQKGDSVVIEQYDFDEYGNVTEYKKEENERVTQAERYLIVHAEDKQRSQEKTIYAKKDTLCKYPFDLFTFEGDEYTDTYFDAYKNPITRETSWTVVGYDTSVQPPVPTKQMSLTTYEYDDNQRAIKETTEITTQKRTGKETVYAVKTYAYNAQGNVVRTESYIEGEEYTAGKTIEETVYDEKGRVVKSYTYNSLDSSSKFYTESEYDERGKVIAEIDETGENKTKLEYVDGTETVRTRTLPNGSKFGYGHDVNGEVTAITQSTASGEENSTQIGRTCGEITELRSGNNVVRYEYDYKRRKTAVDLNDTKDYVTYAYDDITKNSVKAGEKVTATIANGDAIESECDLHGNVLKTTYKAYDSDNKEYTVIPLMTADYNKRNRLTKLEDKISGIIHRWDHDSLDRIREYTGGGVKEEYAYDPDGDVREKAITVDGEKTVYTYEYKGNNAKDLDRINVCGISVSPKSDVLGRNTGKKISVGGTDITEEHIAYRKVGDHATNMPSAMRFGDMRNDAFVLLDNLKYKYDACGNISEIRENGTLAARYTYDQLNRIIREDNKQLGKTTLYTYDNNGNILSKREFAFTLKATELLEELTETQSALYAYSGDRLLSYGDESFVYDEIGNPVVYRGKACVWEKGRQYPYTHGENRGKVKKNSSFLRKKYRQYR